MARESELMMNCSLCIVKPIIVTTIKVRRIERAGHLIRMSDDRTVKKVFLGKPDARTKA